MVVNRRYSLTIPSMWENDRSALQSLHKVSSKAREENYFQGGLTHSWVNYYEERIESDRSCLNEWHAMDNLESRRPPSPDSVRTKPRERDETEKVIRSTLKEIMMSVDLDEVTSKYIRSRLEEDLDMDLGEYKSFIDQEMLIILGQMDAPTEIFEHVYLGSEWNASNYEELQRNGVGHILNVTREIDNFFPGTFDYLNIRVYDDEKTDLLKHWDNTYKYISKARKEGSKVLVHCKMGVSRSASVVIAYAMKAYDWDFKTALQHVKDKRSCIKPNTSFLSQLETYQGILDAMKNKEKLQRSKSETNLKSPGMVAKNERVLVGSEPTPIVQTLMNSHKLQTTMSGSDLRQLGVRPKSWSPGGVISSDAVPLPLGKSKSPPIFLSLDNLHQRNIMGETLKTLKEKQQSQATTSQKDVSLARNMLMPCDNGESYSVSPNQIVHLPGQKDSSGQVTTSVKERVSELESQQEKKTEKKKLVLNLSSQFDNVAAAAAANDAEQQQTESESGVVLSEESAVAAQMKQPPTMLRAVLVKKEIWDPGERESAAAVNKVSYCNGTTNNACDFQSSVSSEEQTVWTSSAVLKTERGDSISCCNKVINDDDDKVVMMMTSDEDSKNINIVPEAQVQVQVQSQTLLPADPFSNQLDKVFDREERRHHRISAAPTILPPSVANEELARESPSRQNSWSSYDSAVVLGYQGETRETPSRHSSWGSGDTRTLPSRNSSWGSYDMRPGATAYYINEKGEKVLNPSCSDLLDSSSSGMFQYDKEDIPWYLGTVKRTKQKLEENSCNKKLEGDDNNKIDSDSNDDKSSKEEEERSTQLPNTTTLPPPPQQTELVEAVNTALINNNNNNNNSKPAIAEKNQLVVVDQSNSSSAISSEIDIVKHRKRPPPTCSSRLSASAPETSSMELVSHECSLSRSASNVSRSASNVSGGVGKITRDSSSPNIISTAQCSSVKQHKTYLENLYKDSKNIIAHRKSSFIPDDLAHNDEQNTTTNISGIVRNRKKEFEAKTHLSELSDDFKQPHNSNKSKVNSLPSSPVSVHVEKENNNKKGGDASPTSSSDPGEDLNLKKLIGKFEVSAKEKKRASPDTQVTLRPKVAAAKLFHKNARHSCFEVSVEKNNHQAMQNHNKNVSIADKNVDSDYKRPPISPTPNVVVATVIAKAVKKQQQYGKSHPLARLNIRPRHNSPVYNTM